MFVIKKIIESNEIILNQRKKPKIISTHKPKHVSLNSVSYYILFNIPC